MPAASSSFTCDCSCVRRCILSTLEQITSVRHNIPPNVLLNTWYTAYHYWLDLTDNCAMICEVLQSLNHLSHPYYCHTRRSRLCLSCHTSSSSEHYRSESVKCPYLLLYRHGIHMQWIWKDLLIPVHPFFFFFQCQIFSLQTSTGGKFLWCISFGEFGPFVSSAWRSSTVLFFFFLSPDSCNVSQTCAHGGRSFSSPVWKGSGNSYPLQSPFSNCFCTVIISPNVLGR